MLNISWLNYVERHFGKVKVTISKNEYRPTSRTHFMAHCQRHF